MRINSNIAAAIAINSSQGYANSANNLPKVLTPSSSSDPARPESRAIVIKPTYSRNQQRTLYTKGRFVDSYV